jgi:hypothetical protein
VILTLTWKEFREHLPIWLTMVVMTCTVGSGLTRLVSANDPVMAHNLAGLAILCLAATYGVVCGSMMLAGEHEAGTLVLLDVFLGRRGLLWIAKVPIGLLLTVSQALAVTVVLRLLNQATPVWGMGLMGLGNQMPDHFRWLRAVQGPHDLWLLLLPLITVEAYAWGLLGSALTRRVLTAAACAVGAATPVWCLGIGAPAEGFLTVRLLAILVVLVISCVAFVNQARETSSEPALAPDEPSEDQKKFLEMQRQLYRIDQERMSGRAQGHSAGVQVLAPVEAASAETMDSEPVVPNPFSARRQPQQKPARSPGVALWWLSVQQARRTWIFLAIACFVIGTSLPVHGQVLWPVATLVLGVVCGTATFAADQRDLSYQFLAAQHLPMPAIWRFKTLFWFATATVAAVVLFLWGLVCTAISLRSQPPGNAALLLAPRFPLGTLPQLMGPVLFFGIWLVHGFCTGQIIVWLCRKTILALLLSLLVSAAAVGVWLPSLLCRGMSGWQMWLVPLCMLAASRLLVRVWAGGRILERKFIYSLAGLGLAAMAWFGVNLGYRAWEVRDAGEPLDLKAFRLSIPAGEENLAATKIKEAADIVLEGNIKDYSALLAEAERLPVGVLEIPPSGGQPYLLRHLPACIPMTNGLCLLAQGNEKPDRALDYLAQVLALSRNLRRKAPYDSYLTGLRIEKSACAGLEQWLTGARSKPALLRRALDKLNRHVAETPPLLDCLEAECYRSAGLLEIPISWNFAQPGGRATNRIPEPWLVRGIVQSLEIPWEAERKVRLWRAVWAGLFRGGQTPCWQLPAYPPDAGPAPEPVRTILHGWLPVTKGPEVTMTAAQLARLLEASWVTDARLFCPLAPLQVAATRARFRIDADRLTIALVLHQVEAGKPVDQLDDLVPKYLAQLPVDPYNGQGFRYRISRDGEPVRGVNGEDLGPVRVGQGILWSTGPDRVDDGGRADGGRWEDDDSRWSHGGFDLIRVIPLARD